jgi:FkbM family methyltransferase
MVDKSDYKDNIEFRVRELEKENEQLLVQLHRAQEELEQGYATNCDDKGMPVPVACSGVDHGAASADEELQKAFAENQRLQALADVQRAVHQLESSNALNVKLGNLLIDGVNGQRGLVPALGKLARIWRQSSRQVPPATLGGKEFTEVIKAYEKGGFALVEQLLAGQSLSPAMQANAYTVLARRLMERDRVKASEAARRAHALDPKAYRLKWLAFRLHESDDVVEAEAVLDILPAGTPFSDSEARQARLLRHEAKIAREREATQRAASFERRTATESQLNDLTKQRDDQAKLAAERDREIQVLKNANLKLVQEKTALADRNEVQIEFVAVRNQEIASLKQAKAMLAGELRALASARDRLELLTQDQEQHLKHKDDENQSLLENLHRIQEELEQVYDRHDRLQQAMVQLEQEKQGLALECEASSRVAQKRAEEFEALKQTMLKVEQEKQLLSIEYNDYLKFAETRNRESEAIAQAKMSLEQENNKLTVERELQSRVADARDREFEALNQAKTLLSEEMQALTAKHDAQVNALDARERDIEGLKRTQARLEQEKQLLSIEHNVYLKFAETRNRESELIAQAKMSLEQENNKLTVERELQSRVADARDREFEALNQAKTQLSEDMQALTAKHDAQVKASDARERDIEGFKRTQARLEQEKQDLTAKHDLQIKTTKTREVEIDALKKANLQLSREKAALRIKNQISAKKVGGDDAEIDDFIVDLDLFFSGKAIVYVDVGSYVGDVFLKIKRVAKKFRIHEAHLFEPNPVSYERLLERVSAEDGTTLHTYNFAVSGSGNQQFIKARSMTKALPADAQIGGMPADVFTAQSVSLDRQRSIFTDGKVNLLKIDVEGQELDVLAGARELLAAQDVDILYIEVGFNHSGTQQTYFAEIDRFLQPLGYRVLRIYEQKEEWMGDSPLLRRANIAYMSEKFANAHPLKLIQEIQDLKARLDELNGVTTASSRLADTPRP